MLMQPSPSRETRKSVMPKVTVSMESLLTSEKGKGPLLALARPLAGIEFIRDAGFDFLVGMAAAAFDGLVDLGAQGLKLCLLGRRQQTQNAGLLLDIEEYRHGLVLGLFRPSRNAVEQSHQVLVHRHNLTQHTRNAPKGSDHRLLHPRGKPNRRPVHPICWLQPAQFDVQRMNGLPKTLAKTRRCRSSFAVSQPWISRPVERQALAVLGSAHTVSNLPGAYSTRKRNSASPPASRCCCSPSEKCNSSPGCSENDCPPAEAVPRPLTT